ncbi:hypothetical protein L249_2669 [Ophiocordyceps polyrhachis-furcata BCC 54312]|uniref:Copper-fist domain-containing protein n=1 Tax=Ophiocordyceps polyrhachis-furcata BCC 54312 TaxID=1330021 RepID=A0A367LPT3_9HYPO|nr:hypothetical protein L249_2669 [Ophiocordyceps polyrhachis-furcata BCC 54312]
MLIDGEKYACDACVRGHRVSNCQHSDRPLQHINKKGRPVSQCQHCRTMRKSRSAHVKCDCGEKTSKCAHLQQPVDGHKETCCCNHGGRCTCSLEKKLSLDTVHESDSDGCESASLNLTLRPKSAAAARRRRANTAHPDTVLAFDQNVHHKPVTKLNRTAYKCVPYSLSRVSSSASPGSIASDGLLFSSDSQPPVSIPVCSLRSRTLTHEQRRVKSETTSPRIGAGFASLNSALPRLDLSNIDCSVSTNNNSGLDMFGSCLPPDHDAAAYSAGINIPSVDWNHYKFSQTKTDAPPSSFGHPFGGGGGGGDGGGGCMAEFVHGSDHIPRLANTTSTSGDVSEVEDAMSGDFNRRFGTGGFLRHQGGNLLGQLNSIDYDGLYPHKTESSGLIPVSMVEDDAAFWVPGYNESITAMEEGPNPLGPTNVESFWDI